MEVENMYHYYCSVCKREFQDTKLPAVTPDHHAIVDDIRQDNICAGVSSPPVPRDTCNIEVVSLFVYECSTCQDRLKLDTSLTRMPKHDRVGEKEQCPGGDALLIEDTNLLSGAEKFNSTLRHAMELARAAAVSVQEVISVLETLDSE